MEGKFGTDEKAGLPKRVLGGGLCGMGVSEGKTTTGVDWAP